MAVIESAVAHQSDAIRARTCSAFSQLIIIDATPSNNLNYISLLLRSLGNLLPSADPTARNTAVHAFFEAAVCLRNRCVNQPTTGTQKEPRLSAAAASSGDGENKYCKFEAANGYPDANLNVIVGIPRYSKTLSPLDVLGRYFLVYLTNRRLSNFISVSQLLFEGPVSIAGGFLCYFLPFTYLGFSL